MNYLIGFQRGADCCPECGSNAIEFAERTQMYAVVDGTECKACGHWWSNEDDAHDDCDYQDWQPDAHFEDGDA